MKQCKKCPWRVDVDPHDIPNGYSEDAHAALEGTIAHGFNIGSALRIMACHESPSGKEKACAGYLDNQLGVGNNIGLRLWAIREKIGKLELIGEQHKCFEDTLPYEHREKE